MILQRPEGTQRLNIIFLHYIGQSRLLANGTTSARGVARGEGNGDVLQTGQVGCSLNHGSTHLR